MKKILVINLIIILTATSIFAQENNSENSGAEKNKNMEQVKSEVVVNEKFIAKYQKFMDSGEYVSLWETVKDYSFKEMSGYYKTYKNYEFTEETTYPEIKIAYEKEKEEINLAEESAPLKKQNTSELLTKIQ